MRMLPTASAVTEKLPRFFRRHRLMTAWMKMTGESPLQLVRIRDNHFGYADMSDGFLRLIVIDQGFEHEFFRIADAFLANGGVFLDVGANFGLLSFGLAGVHGSAIDFHLFEPNPTLLDVIDRTRAFYPQMRCTITPVAVSDAPGTACFSIDPGQTGVSHIDENGQFQVQTIRLDDYLDDKAIARVELMKIDIEGYELFAFRGAAKSLQSRRIRAVYYEYQEPNLIRVGPPHEVIDFLSAQGFVTCLCRTHDFIEGRSATHTLAHGEPGHGLPLRPLDGEAPPRMTDLLAVPREHLVPL